MFVHSGPGLTSLSWLIRHRNIVDASSLRDIRDARVHENFSLPKLYIKQFYSVEAAVHQRIVRSRSRIARKNREPPKRPERRQN